MFISTSVVGWPLGLALPQLSNLAEFFGGAVSFGFILVIAVTFVTFCWRYLRPVWRAQRVLRGATDRLNRKEPDEEIFRSAPEYLKNLWTNYRRARIDASVNRWEGGGMVTTVAPEDVFTWHAVLEGYNRNFAVTLAGIFTGAGILGTFVGLVIGLSRINPSPGSDEVLSGVYGLLEGMETAFWTSIAGISASLLWLILDRTLGHDVQKQAARFFAAVKVRYPVASAEWFLHRLFDVEQDESRAIHRGVEILTGTNELVSEQKAILQTLGTDLASAFQEQVSGQLAPLLQDVVSNVQTLSTQMGDRQVHAMERLVGTFQDQLSEQLHGQFEHLSSALEDAAKWQQLVHGDMEQLLVRVQQSTQAQQEVIDRSSAACDLYGGTLERLSEGHTQLDRSAHRLEETSAQIAARLGEAAEQMAAGLTDAVDSSRKLTVEVASTVERLSDQAAVLNAGIAALRAEQDVYRDANAEIRTHLAHHIDELGGQVSELSGFWNDFRAELSSVSERLQESAANFSVLTAEKLREIFARFDAEMATVVEHLSGTLAEVREVNEDLPVGIERLRTTFQEATEPLVEAGEAARRFDETATRLSHLMEGLPELSQAMRALEPVAPQLQSAVARVSSTDQSIERLREQILATGDQLAVLLRSGTDFGNGGRAPRAPLDQPPGSHGGA